MPTWVHVGANIGPCWLKKTVLAGLGPFWRPLGPSCLEAGGGLGGRNCKGIDPRGVLRRFEASSRPLGGDVRRHVDNAGGFGGSLDPLRGRDPRPSDPRPLRGVHPKGRRLNPGTPSCRRTVADYPAIEHPWGPPWGPGVLEAHGSLRPMGP